MTTIAYRAGILAADGRVTYSDGVLTDNFCKITKLSDGALFALSGENSYAVDIIRHLEQEGVDLPVGDSFTALLVEVGGTIKLYEGNGDFFEIPTDYISIGSGSAYAYGAMDTGATAEEAVRAAIKRDPISGGRVQVERLGTE